MVTNMFLSNQITCVLLNDSDSETQHVASAAGISAGFSCFESVEPLSCGVGSGRVFTLSHAANPD